MRGDLLEWNHEEVRTMLTVTDTAAAEIRNLIARPEVPEGGGMRIASDPAAGSLTLSLAPEPSGGDAVLDTAGARVFLDTAAASMLDDKALDATTDPEGRVQFVVAEQPT
jgi:iron-sulfur cluster assembly protein